MNKLYCITARAYDGRENVLPYYRRLAMARHVVPAQKLFSDIVNQAENQPGPLPGFEAREIAYIVFLLEKYTLRKGVISDFEIQDEATIIYGERIIIP